MKRAPIILAATAAGLAGVLTFHSHRPSSTVAVDPSSSAGGGSTSTATPATTSPSGSAGPTSPSTTTPSASGGPAAPATTTPAASRSATGQVVQYRYGQLSVTVSEQAGRITGLQMASLSETDARSVFIDDQAIPLLRQQVLAAQNANIDGVSGATFTSQAYAQSVQSALDQLGIR
jgi:uncharacterized protein with FMN-binding domain